MSSPSFFPSVTPPGSYSLTLHDALPISCRIRITVQHPTRAEVDVLRYHSAVPNNIGLYGEIGTGGRPADRRSAEHTSELQSQSKLVCRLVLEKEKMLVIDLDRFFSSYRR